MNVEFTTEQLELVTAIAERNGVTVGKLMSETASWLVQSEEDSRIRLTRSIEQADRGEFIEEEEMDARFAHMLQPR